MKVLIIINPTSGRKQYDQARARIEAFCERQDFASDIWRWSHPEEIDELMAEAQIMEFDTIVAAGGDGTVHQIAGRLIGTDVQLGILPIGTGNAIANHLEIPLDLDAALEVLVDHEVVRLDTGLVDDQVFIGFFGMGLDAAVAHAYVDVKRRNLFTYAYYAVRCYLAYKRAPPVRIRCADGQEFAWDATLLTVANGSEFGLHAVLAPGASMTDGRLDLFGVWAPSFWHFALLSLRLFRGDIDRSRYYKRIQGTEFTLIRPGAGVAQIDGEPFETEAEVVIRVAPASLRVLAPRHRKKQI